MTVKELFCNHTFDELASEIIKICPEAANYIAHYREAYDMLLHTTPKLNSKRLSVKYEYHWIVDGTTRKLMQKPFVEVRYKGKESAWASHLGSKLRVGEGLSYVAAAARILFMITWHGFSPEEIDKKEYSWNIYDQKALELRRRLMQKYYPKRNLDKRYYQKFKVEAAAEEKMEKSDGDGETDIDDKDFFSDLSLRAKHSVWLDDYCYQREIRLNRTKRMRANRYECHIKRMEYMSCAENYMCRILKSCPDLQREQMGWMFDGEQISEELFTSRAYDLSRRLAYLLELLSKYDKPYKKPYCKVGMMLRTSPEHPLTDDERATLDRIAALYGEPSQVTVYVGTAPALDTEADLYIVRVSNAKPPKERHFHFIPKPKLKKKITASQKTE